MSPVAGGAENASSTGCSGAVSKSASDAGSGVCAGASAVGGSAGTVTAGSSSGATTGACCDCAGISDMVGSTATSAIPVGTSCVSVVGIASSCTIARTVPTSGAAACPQPVSSKMVQMVSSIKFFHSRVLPSVLVANTTTTQPQTSQWECESQRWSQRAIPGFFSAILFCLTAWSGGLPNISRGQCGPGTPLPISAFSISWCLHYPPIPLPRS